MGPAAGGAVYSPALTDFVVMVDKTSQMFVTGPDVIKTVTGEDVGMEELGGAYTHNTRSGVAHYLAEDEDDAIDYVRTLLGFLPDNNMAELPVYESGFEFETTDADRFLNTIIPDSPNQPYDIHQVIRASSTPGDFLEVQPLFAPNIVIGFGRVEGRTVGIIANQPSQMAGTLNIEAGEKASRFVRFCDAFSIPIVTLVDVPGYLPGTDQEWTGVIRRGAKLLYAYAEATVPLVTVILRKAYGGAYIVMGSKQLGADVNLAWPTAEIAVMGGQGAVNILYRGEIKRAEEAGEDVAAVRTRLANEYTYNVASPFLAAERGELDGIIEPAQTRVVDREGAAGAARQARQPAAQEAREHPAVTGAADRGDRTASRSTSCRGTPTEEELAALIAVVSEAYARRRRTPSPRSRRPRRRGRCRSARCAQPLRRDLGWGAADAGGLQPDDPAIRRPELCPPKYLQTRPVDRARILEQLERFCVRPTCSPLCGEPRFGHADGFRVTVRQARGGRLRRPSPPPIPLPAPAPLPRRDGERVLVRCAAAHVGVRRAGSRARGRRRPRRDSSAPGGGPPDDGHRDALVRRRADVEAVGARRAQRLGQLGADDREGCLVQPVEAALVEHRDVRAAAAGAFEFGAHGVVEQPRAAHLVAQAALGEPRLEPVVVVERAAGRRPCASSTGPATASACCTCTRRSR